MEQTQQLEGRELDAAVAVLHHTQLECIAVQGPWFRAKFCGQTRDKFRPGDQFVYRHRLWRVVAIESNQVGLMRYIGFVPGRENPATAICLASLQIPA